MKKRAVLELLREMPEEIDAEELMYRLYVLRKLEIAEAELEAGELVSQEEVERVTKTWFE